MDLTQALFPGTHLPFGSGASLTAAEPRVLALEALPTSPAPVLPLSPNGTLWPRPDRSYQSSGSVFREEDTISKEHRMTRLSSSLAVNYPRGSWSASQFLTLLPAFSTWQKPLSLTSRAPAGRANLLRAKM